LLQAPDTGTREKSYNFILESKKNNIAFDYQLNLLIKDQIKTIYFIGIALGNNLLIIGADNHKEAIEFTNHLQQISNEQANHIRALLKEKTSKTGNTDNETKLLFDEFSRLNNELVNLQRELSKKNVELSKLNDLKNQFLGMAAHDLRNPLGVIQSYAEFLIEEASDKLSEEHQKFLDTIYNSTDFMLKLIEDLLDISKIESGKIQLFKESFDLVPFTRDIIKLNRILASKKKIEVSFDFTPDQIQVTADRQKLEQVINNLLTNAIKFSFPESTVYVNIQLQSNIVKMSVKDQGIGIAAEDMVKLFVPFTKITNKGTRGEKGTGLGLSIVKKIINSHEGEIEVFSEVGKGTEFIVNLPVN
jgi:signal transduction histidine kinase